GAFTGKSRNGLHGGTRRKLTRKSRSRMRVFSRGWRKIEGTTTRRTVKGIIPDADVQGHFHALMTVIRSPPWIDYWLHLQLATPTFQDLGLALNSPDREVWQICQREELVLVTGNRNSEGPDSLE